MGIHYNKGAELLDFVKNKEDFNMEGGFFKPLMKPGLGVEIDEARVVELSKMRRTGEIRCGGMRMDLSPNGKCFHATGLRAPQSLTNVSRDLQSCRLPAT